MDLNIHWVESLMKICVCFTGLQRTIEQNYQNLYINLFNNNEIEFEYIFVTWKNESTEKFSQFFPNATIFKIDEITMDNELFQSWSKSIQMHISWRRTYEPPKDLFRYFQQIYLWKHAALILELIKQKYDLCMRVRTDIRIHGAPIHALYPAMNENTIYFPTEPRQGIFFDGKACPDYYFIGKPDIVIKALSIVDYLHKYKVNYIEKDPKWFPVETLEENIIQPESSMYLFLEGENINIEYLPNHIELIR